MNILNFSGQWHLLQGRVKQKWAKLTEDELTYQDGKKEELIGRIQQRAAEGHQEREQTCNCGNCRSGAGKPEQPSEPARV